MVTGDTSISFESLEVEQFSIGRVSGILISKDQEAYVWGNNANGQLGLGDKDGRKKLVKLEILDEYGIPKKFNFVDMSPNNSAAAIMADGSVYLWGYGGANILADAGATAGETTPKKSNLLTNLKVVHLDLGNMHGVAHDSSGKTFSWGSNTSGALGIGSTGGFKSVPQLIMPGFTWNYVGTKSYYETLIVDYEYYPRQNYYHEGWYFDEDNWIEASIYMPSSDIKVYIKQGFNPN